MLSSALKLPLVCSLRWTKDFDVVRWLMCFVCFLVPCLCVASSSECDTSTTYLCSNKRCIQKHLVNNSVNDCEDNSDEVPNPCRSPLFSCRNDRCVMMQWVLNGRNDCLDGTDEVKLIGTDCTTAVNCCFCSEYVRHSECIDGICQCISTHFSNTLRTACLRRKVSDECSFDDHCTASIRGSVYCHLNGSQEDSHSSKCRCRAGYRALADGLACVSRSLGDQCTYDVDCGSVTTTNEVECFDGVCSCVNGRMAASKHSCRRRRIGDTCQLDSDCSLAMNRSVCSDGVCACQFDYFWNATANGCLYDGIDSQHAAVGITLVVVVVVVSVVDILFIVGLIIFCVRILYSDRLSKCKYSISKNSQAELSCKQNKRIDRNSHRNGLC